MIINKNGNFFYTINYVINGIEKSGLKAIMVGYETNTIYSYFKFMDYNKIVLSIEEDNIN